MPTLVLLDGHSLAYRAFYALPSEMATTSGQVTNAAFGFMRMLVKLLGDRPPDRLAVAWDVGRATFRSERFPEYKAQRESAPDIFKSQLPLIDQTLQGLGISQFRMPGYEADDVIASMATQAKEAGWSVLVVTGDRDSFQLVDDEVKVIYTRRGISDTVLADSAWVEERYGIRPDQYVEYAALRGDSSDNLPGVPGVGEKTAAKLISAYGGLEAIFEHLDEQTPKLRENLAAHREQVFLNRELMELKRDLDTGAELDALVWTEWDEKAVKDLFESLEFHAMWDDLLAVHPEWRGQTGEVLEVEAAVVTDPTEVAGCFASPPVSIDVVLEGAEPAGLMVGLGASRAAYLTGSVLAAAAPFLEDPAVAKQVHDAKEAMRHLASLGIDLDGVTFDTALAAYVVNPAARGYDLASVAERFLALELESPDAETETTDQGAFDFEGVGGPDLDSAARRVTAVERLAEHLAGELDSRDERTLFDDIEMPLIPVLRRMESLGIAIDREYLEGLGEDLREELATLETAIHEAAGGVFNINSTLQLREVLYDRLNLPVLKKTSKGVPSTDASVLAKLEGEHPIVASLLRYRELEKLRGTYVDGLLPLIENDGRIHTTFNQMAAATGRLSSDHPTLQNIPVRSETGRLVRKAFVPEPGWTFVVADYSQIELRILAHLSNDSGLLHAFGEAQRDIHTATAASVFGVPLDEVTQEMRRRAKAINFGLLYGMEAFGLADRLEIGREEAKEHIEKYFATFPDVKAFMGSIVDDAKSKGYTSTLFGRRRYLPELRSDNWRVRQMGERMALNAPVQGTAADIIKMAMLAVDRALEGFSASLLLQIHDELVVEAPPGELDDVTKIVVAEMEGVADLAVTLAVDVATGATLADCKP